MLRLQYLFTSFFLGLILSSPIHAQSPCAADFIYQEQLTIDADFAQRRADMERRLQNEISSEAFGRNQLTITIPVVVHVLHTGQAVGIGFNISDAQIQSAIDRLNVIFAEYDYLPTSPNIRFELAKRDPTTCLSANGINRVNATGVVNYHNVGMKTDNSRLNLFNLSRWNTKEYMNIWVVSEIDNNNGGNGVQGFATFPGTLFQYDGVVCLYNTFGYDPDGALGYNLKNTSNQNEILVHEVGHYLDLYHTFQGDDINNDGQPDTCPSATGCGTDGDCCDDTDPHKRYPHEFCLDIALNECNGYSAFGDIFENYMNYTHQNCQTKFTVDQFQRMQGALFYERPGLWTSPGLEDIAVTEPTSACIPQTSSTGINQNWGTGITKIYINGWVSESGNTFEEGGYQDNWCRHMNMIPNKYYFCDVDTYGNLDEYVRCWIDYNNNGIFENPDELVLAPSTKGDNHLAFFISPADVLYNTPLRMRWRSSVISDNDPCYSPNFGQAEDYTVYFKNNAELTASVSALNGLDKYTCCEPNVGSFTVTGIDLFSNVTLALSNSNFEISTDNINFSDSLSLSTFLGSLDVDPSTIYTRLKPGLPANNYKDTITISCTLAEDVIIPLAGEVLAPDGFRGKSYRIPNANANNYAIADDFVGITGTSSRTYEAWINCQQNKGAFFTNGIQQSGKKWTIRLDNGRLRAEIGNAYKVGSTILNDGEWHHIAVVLDNSSGAKLANTNLYVDGKLETISKASGVNNQINTADTKKLWLGKDHSTAHYQGYIEEARIWSVARSQSEIRESMHLTLDGTETGLEAYYQFNENNTTCKDVVNGHDLTINGAYQKLESHLDVASGTSSTINVAAFGDNSIEIDSDMLKIDFENNGVAPNGDVVVYHLDSEAPNEPSIAVKSQEHWVVRNFGNNQSNLDISNIEMTIHTDDPILSYTPTTMRLFKRASGNTEQTAWSQVANLSTGMDYTTGAIQFNDLINFTSFSQLLIGSDATALPIEISSFTAQRKNIEQVHLNWTTSTESNISHFEIERSYDGRIFEVIGKEKAKGENNSSHAYFFQTLERKAAYYRIVQVDLDFSESLSEVRYVPGKENNEVFVLFPNPADRSFRLSSSGTQTEDLDLSIVDINGRVMMNTSGSIEALNQRIAANFERFSEGVYLIQLKRGFEVWTERLVVSRRR